MPRCTIADAALEAEIGRLPDLSLLELRNRWKTLFGHSAPKSLRRNFLARAVAYQMQVVAYGGTIGRHKTPASGNRHRRTKW